MTEYLRREDVERAVERRAQNYERLGWTALASAMRETLADLRALPPAKGEGELRAEIQKWRDDAFETAAGICERYGLNEYAIGDIRALKSQPQSHQDQE